MRSNCWQFRKKEKVGQSYTKRRLKDMKKVPFVTKEKLEEIIKEYPTPFHLYDERGIRRNMEALRESPSK